MDRKIIKSLCEQKIGIVKCGTSQEEKLGKE